jgi:hypothetical protein
MPSEANSIDHQIAVCKRFAKKRGWTVRRAVSVQRSPLDVEE